MEVDVKDVAGVVLIELEEAAENGRLEDIEASLRLRLAAIGGEMRLQRVWPGEAQAGRAVPDEVLSNPCLESRLRALRNSGRPSRTGPRLGSNSDFIGEVGLWPAPSRAGQAAREGRCP